MAVIVKDGNIFTTPCQTIVNTINCVGVMGAGIALECRLRYPAMFEKYRQFCDQSKFTPGVLWLYKGGTDARDMNNKWILNFPTKVHWKYPSKLEWVIVGLEKFLSVYEEKEINSVAFPVLGGLNGGLDPEEVISVMVEKLGPCTIPVEIYRYRTDAGDDLYNRFKATFSALSDEEISTLIGMRKNYVKLVRAALENPNVCQLNQLARIDGVGARTLEKAFELMRKQGAVQTEFKL